MPNKEWIARDDRENAEANLAEGRSIGAISLIVIVMIVAIIAYTVLR